LQRETSWPPNSHRGSAGFRTVSSYPSVSSKVVPSAAVESPPTEGDSEHGGGKDKGKGKGKGNDKGND